MFHGGWCSPCSFSSARGRTKKLGHTAPLRPRSRIGAWTRTGALMRTRRTVALTFLDGTEACSHRTAASACHLRSSTTRRCAGLVGPGRIRSTPADQHTVNHESLVPHCGRYRCVGLLLAHLEAYSAAVESVDSPPRTLPTGFPTQTHAVSLSFAINHASKRALRAGWMDMRTVIRGGVPLLEVDVGDRCLCGPSTAW